VLCIYHHGSSNTFLSSVHLLPESNTAMVVLTNSMGNNDTADWVGELLLQTILDVPPECQHDHIKLAIASAERSSNLWIDMAEKLEQERVPNTKPQGHDQYVGKYFNKVKTYHIEVLERDGKLMMCFQGRHEQLYDLEHYHYDVFSWSLTRDEDVRRGRFPVTRPQFYLFHFKSAGTAGEINGLVWSNDPAVPEGELFLKEEALPVEICSPFVEGPT
jgi:hypothetical protein